MSKEKNDKAFHGGAFFDAVGVDFSALQENIDKVVKADVLDAWFAPAPSVVEVLQENIEYIVNTSPPTYAQGLVSTIAEARGISEGCITVNGGSSDLMFALFPSIVCRHDTVMILDPMYGEYLHIFENVIGCAVEKFHLSKDDAFSVDSQRLSEEIKCTKPRCVVIVNPNSPTGKHLLRSDLLDIIRSSSETLFVIDETYIEYVGAEQSLEKEVANYDNVIIIKSMSKTYALSGVRVGYLVAPEKITRTIQKVIPPWSVSLPGQIAAVKALGEADYYQQQYKETEHLRQMMTDQLAQHSGIKVYDGVCNSVLVELISKDLSAEGITVKLQQQNIFVRNCDSMSEQFDDNFLRLSVVRKDHLTKMLDALDNFLR